MNVTAFYWDLMSIFVQFARQHPPKVTLHTVELTYYTWLSGLKHTLGLAAKCVEK